MYAGRVAYCPLVSHGEYADRRDRLTPYRYIMLSARRGQSVTCLSYCRRLPDRRLDRHWHIHIPCCAYEGAYASRRALKIQATTL